MKNLRQIFLGIIIALASTGLILGGFSLSMTEGAIGSNPATAQTQTPTTTSTFPPSVPAVDSATPSPTATLIPTLPFISTETPTWTPSLSPSPTTNCPPPVGWLPYVVQTGDTLDKIASRYRTSAAMLQQANCLLTATVTPGMLIYVPPIPTQTSLACGRPAGWIVYIVQSGDTLYRLSQAYGITVAQLQQANCMGNSTLLRAGQTLYVPPWPPHTPTPTYPVPVFPTATPTMTPEISLPSDTPTEIPTSVPTEPPAPTASDTPVVIPTDTVVPSSP
jgi:LysM repeat protein